LSVGLRCQGFAIIVVVRERYCVPQEYSCIVRSSVDCEDQPCSWVRREGREEKERDMQAKCTDRTV
jgi:hypothetical protein